MQQQEEEESLTGPPVCVLQGLLSLLLPVVDDLRILFLVLVELLVSLVGHLLCRGQFLQHSLALCGVHPGLLLLLDQPLVLHTLFFLTDNGLLEVINLALPLRERGGGGGKKKWRRIQNRRNE